MRNHAKRAVIIELLSDGNWHTWQEVFARIEGLFPPEECLRRCRLDGYPTGDLIYAVGRGRKRLVHNYMNDLVYENAIERRGRGINADYRMSTNGKQRTRKGRRTSSSARLVCRDGDELS